MELTRIWGVFITPAQHHAAHIASVIRKAIESAGDVEVDGIAFSQGSGMEPCPRTVATAARALALSLDVPLIGVNHCVAHLEIGRWQCGIDDPVMLYVSGANSQVLAYRQGRRCSILKMCVCLAEAKKPRDFTRLAQEDDKMLVMCLHFIPAPFILSRGNLW